MRQAEQGAADARHRHREQDPARLCRRGLLSHRTRCATPHQRRGRSTGDRVPFVFARQRSSSLICATDCVCSELLPDLALLLHRQGQDPRTKSGPAAAAMAITAAGDWTGQPVWAAGEVRTEG